MTLGLDRFVAALVAMTRDQAGSALVPLNAFPSCPVTRTSSIRPASAPGVRSGVKFRAGHAALFRQHAQSLADLRVEMARQRRLSRGAQAGGALFHDHAMTCGISAAGVPGRGE